MRRLAQASLLAGACLMVPLIARADDSYYTLQVKSRLTNLANRMGYEVTTDPYVSLLGRETYDTVTYELEAGTTYMVMATCDEDCEDLDLELYDADGNFLETDDAVDPTPMISFTPEVSGLYSVNVVMYACSVESCYQAVDIFEVP